MPDTKITSADGTKLAARNSGVGSPLVLVHGALGNLDIFLPIEPLLAERHEVWVYSYRGHLGSDATDDYGIDRQVEDVLSVVDAAGGEVHLFGWSMGAAFAMLAAQRSTSLRSLILYEPPLKIDPATTRILIDTVQTALDKEGPDGALEAFFPIAGVIAAEVEALRSDAQVWEALRQGIQVLPHELAVFAEQPDDSSGFESPDVPTLYLYGEQTESPVFATANEVAEMFPKAHLRALAGQRHMANVFDPGVFAAAILEFTSAHDG